MKADLGALARGCAIYGSGGGGDPTFVHMVAEAAIDMHGPVELRTLDEFDDDALLLPVAMLGSPTVALEKLLSGNEGVRLRDGYEQMTGRKVAALMPAEVGGGNGVLPVSWAAQSGLPLADADLIGRAFPQLHHAVANLKGIPVGPGLIVDERGNTIRIDCISARWAESIVRSAAMALGGMVAAAFYPMTVAQARQAAIVGSVSMALEAGRSMVAQSGDRVDALLKIVDGRDLIRGKIVDVDRRTEGGFAFGAVTIEGLAEDRGRLLRLEFQNEILVAMIDGDVVASTPDIITVIDAHTAYAVTAEMLRYGQRVSVITFLGTPECRTTEALKIFGPRAFGYDFDYTSQEDTNVSAP